jgi:hypothetical protein
LKAVGEDRQWIVFGVLALVLALLALAHCGSLDVRAVTKAQMACVAPSEAEFATALVAQCPDRATRNECPALPALRAKRQAAQRKAGCRE